MKIVDRSKLRLVAAALCVASMSFATSCSGPPHVTTTSYYDTQVGATPVSNPDPSAITTIGNAYLAANTTGCFAIPGGQPPPPYPWDPNGVNNLVGSSPDVGQCYFSAFLGNSKPWYFNFYSGVCATTGQPSDWSGYLTTDSHGRVSQTVCTIPAYNAPSAGSHFAISGSLPSSVTVGAAGLSQTNGMPQLLVYDSSLALVTTVTATSVAGDGSSGTFPFPTSLAQGTYMFAVKNFTGSSGQFKVVDATYYSVGGNPTLSSAFGVDAVDLAYTAQTCYQGQYGWTCNPPTYSSGVLPMVTQYNANQVSYGSQTIPVGVRPVAIKAYNFGTFTDSQNQNTTVTHTGPGNAIVVNSGSNSVSILNIATGTYGVAANIAVGTQPMAVAVNSASTKAYVANYGSGTLSEVNLSTDTVSRTATFGSGLLSVAMDPGGSYVWVGGTNNLYKVSVSTFAVVATYAVSGSVTSLAASNAQNELVYTLVQNCCSPSSTFVAKEVSLSNMGTRGSYAQVSANPYAPYTMNGTLPNAAVSPQASAVSTQFGNGMAASSTPTGFIVYDVVSHKQLMAGTTPTPVRGIASDPSNTVVYLTVPDSNEYIVVPLPHL